MDCNGWGLSRLLGSLLKDLTKLQRLTLVLRLDCSRRVLQRPQLTANCLVRTCKPAKKLRKFSLYLCGTSDLFRYEKLSLPGEKEFSKVKDIVRKDIDLLETWPVVGNMGILTQI